MHGSSPAQVWLVRESFCGETLHDLIASGKAPDDRKRILTDILSQLVILEKVGLYHNDVRSWNVLIDSDGRAALSDYGSITASREDCWWPKSLFLSFLIFMREVVLGIQGPASPTRPFWFNPDVLPDYCRRVARLLVRGPDSELSFARVLDELTRTTECTQIDSVKEPPDFDALFQALEAGERLYRDHVAHLESAVAQSGQQIADERNKLETQISVLQGQFRGLEAQLGETHRTKAELEAQLGTAERANADLEARLEETHRTRAAAEAQLGTAERANADLEARLEETHRTRAAAEAQLGKAERANADLEARLEETHRTRAAAEAQLGKAERANADLEARLEETHRTRAAAEAQLGKAERANADLEARLEETHRTRAAAEAQLEEAARTRIELESQLADERRVHTTQLAAIHTSTSWRITAPLRFLGRAARRLLPRQPGR